MLDLRELDKKWPEIIISMSKNSSIGGLNCLELKADITGIAGDDKEVKKLLSDAGFDVSSYPFKIEKQFEWKGSPSEQRIIGTFSQKIQSFEANSPNFMKVEKEDDDGVSFENIEEFRDWFGGESN